jgi:zinc protease
MSDPSCRTTRRAPVRAALLAVLVLALAGPLGGSRSAAAAGPDVVRATLENGLTVVIVRNRLAPVVTTAVNYLVGADETPPGFPGMAHAQEHMMFRGSPELSADQLADIGSVMGGNFNADTRQTVTQYYFTVPAEDLDVALHIEALRMRNVLDNEKAWVQERGAIEQEVARDVSSPRYILSEKLRAALFDGSPYAHDPLGTRPSFDKTTGAMLKAFYDEWYAPNNAILIVVGDVDPDATLVLVKRLFGPIPAKTLPGRAAVELRPVTPRALSIKTDLPYGMQVIALRLPGLDSPDYAAATILADVLSSQRGDLYGLVPAGKALDATFSYDPLPKAGLAYAAVAFPADGDGKPLEKEVRAILARIAKDGVPPDLVAAAKLKEKVAAEFAKNSIAGLATVWSEAVAVDGLDSPDEDIARIEKVTVADVDRVARTYLDLDHAVTAVLTPQGSGKPVASKGFGGQENISLGLAKPTPLPDWAQAALNRLAVPASTVHPVVTTLANGIKLIVQPEDVSDTVSVYGHILNRPDVQVPKGQDGLAQVLDQLFSYGTERLDRVAFQRALDDIGADEGAGTDFQVQVLAENFDRAVELLAENELHPALPEPAFRIVRSQVARAVAGRLTSPGYMTERALRAALFPKTDPTQREALPQTVGALTLKDVRNYYKAAFRPDLTTIVVVGHVTPEQAEAVIEKHFGSWTATGPKPNTDLPTAPPNAASATAVPDASRVQDRVTLAEALTLTRANPDYYALELGNTVLGGAFYATRLTRDLRMKAGLVYSVASYFEVGRTRSVYFVQYACDPQNVSKVHDIVARELEEMQGAPPSADEMQRAKALLLRSIPLDEASVDAIAYGLIDRVRLDLPLDEPTRAARRYLALGAGDVEAAFAKWLRPKDLVRVSLGPTPQ